jgi:hypothetical protein
MCEKDGGAGDMVAVGCSVGCAEPPGGSGAVEVVSVATVATEADDLLPTRRQLEAALGRLRARGVEFVLYHPSRRQAAPLRIASAAAIAENPKRFAREVSRRPGRTSWNGPVTRARPGGRVRRR